MACTPAAKDDEIQSQPSNSQPSVVHVSYTDADAGAARGAYTLHSTLRELGLSSTLLVAHKATRDSTVLPPGGSAAKVLALANKRLDKWLPRLLGNPSDIFTTNLSGSRVIARARDLQPDIVHLHWVGFGTLRPGEIWRLQRPIVWTLRDMWTLTGGCHYNHGCNRFQSRCGACPVLGSRREWDLSTLNQYRKLRAFSRTDVRVVALSHWIADQARKSQTMSRFGVTVIPPGVDLNVFRPVDPTAARAVLGIAQDPKVIFFAAVDPLEPRKGWGHLRTAIRLINEARQDDDMMLLVGGAADESLFRGSAVKSVTLGTVRDDVMMAAAYSAADVTVVPSLEEAFGKVSIESLACGTPVVAFRGTGVAECIRHKATGYLADYGSPVDLARGILWALERRNERILPELQRDRQHYSALREARAYLDLYSELAEFPPAH